MPGNQKFLDVVLLQSQKVKKTSATPSSSWGFLSTPNISQATQTFLNDLASAGVSWGNNKVGVSFQPNSKKKHGIAIALFKYCLARHLANAQGNHDLYQIILKEIPNFYTITDENHRSDFFVEISCIFNESISITNPMVINDLKILTDILFSSFNVAQYQSKLLNDSPFFSACLPNHLRVGENPILNQPMIIEALKSKPENGAALIAHLMNQPITIKDIFTKALIQQWIYLLKNEMIKPEAAPNNVNFMQYWLKTKKEYYKPQHPEQLPATALSQLLHQGVLKELSAQTRSVLLSLPYNEDGLTPLQELANAYVARLQYAHILEKLIVNFLKENISVQHEKSPFWIEILLPHIREESWENILKHIPETMLQEFYHAQLHISLCAQLTEKLEQEDFWTQSLEEKTSNKNINLYSTIVNINKQGGASPIPEAHQKFMRALYQNNKDLKNQLQYGAQWPEPNSMLAQLSGNSIAYFKGQIHALYHQIPVFLDCSPHQCFQFLYTYYICNAVQYDVQLAADPTKEISALEEAAFTIVEHDKQISDDHYKNEIKYSIEKSLRLFSRTFNHFSDHEKIIRHFVMLNNNIHERLREYNLSFEQIVLEHPASRSILKNIYTTLLCFDKDEVLKKSVLYEGIKDDADINALAKVLNVPPTKTDGLQQITKFIHTITNAAKTYKYGSISNTASFYKRGNELNRYCVNSILGGWDEYDKNPSMTNASLKLAVKILLNIINYRIVSYTEEKYEKSFYKNHLADDNLKDYPSVEMQADLKKFKLFFIAQINASLQKITSKNYSGFHKHIKLRTYLFSLKDYFGIELKDLDNNAQQIYSELSSDNIANRMNMQEDDVKFVATVMKKHRDGIIPSVLDAEKLIEMLSTPADISKEFLSLDYMQTVLRVKTATFSAIDVYLEKIHVTLSEPSFADRWFICLNEGLTDKIEFKEKPLLAYFHTRYRQFMSAVATELAAKLLNVTYISKTYTLSLPSVSPGSYLSVASLLYSFKNIAISRAGADTFNPAVWHSFYANREIPNHPYTPLQHFAIEMLTDKKFFTYNLTTLRDMIAKNSAIELENTHDGYWIEMLLAKNNLDKSQQDLMQVIISTIPDTMLIKIIEDKTTREKIINSLLKEVDPFADSLLDEKAYVLYFLLLFRATCCHAEKMMQAPVFIDKLCQLLPYFSTNAQFYRYFKDAYPTAYSPLKDFIKQKIIARIATDLLIDSKKIEILNEFFDLPPSSENQDARAQNIMTTQMICRAVRQAVFLSTSAFKNLNQDYSETEFFKSLTTPLNTATKTAIYASVQKSMTFTFLYGDRKWHSFEYMIGIFNLLDQLAIKLDLDRTKLLPENHHVLIDSYLWHKNKNNYQENDPQLAPFSKGHFHFVVEKANEEECKSNASHHPILENFMTTVIEKSTVYKNSVYNQAKKGNRLSMDCAVTIANLPYANQTILEKRKSFIKALSTIITYRLMSHQEDNFEKSFYTQSFKDPLAQLAAIELPIFHKQALFYDIVYILGNLQTTTSHRYFVSQMPPEYLSAHHSLKDTVLLFIDIFHLEAQFKDFDFKYYLHADTKLATSSPSTTSIISHSAAAQAAMTTSVVTTSTNTTTSTNNNTTHLKNDGIGNLQL